MTVYWYEPNTYALFAVTLLITLLLLHLVFLVADCQLQRCSRPSISLLLWAVATVTVSAIIIEGAMEYHKCATRVPATCQDLAHCSRVNKPLLHEISRKDLEAAYGLLEAGAIDTAIGQTYWEVGEPRSDYESLMTHVRSHPYIWYLNAPTAYDYVGDTFYQPLKETGQNDLHDLNSVLDYITYEERERPRHTALLLYDSLNTFNSPNKQLSYSSEELLERLLGSAKVAQKIFTTIINSTMYRYAYDKVTVFVIADAFYQQSDIKDAYRQARQDLLSHVRNFTSQYTCGPNQRCTPAEFNILFERENSFIPCETGVDCSHVTRQLKKMLPFALVDYEIYGTIGGTFSTW